MGRRRGGAEPRGRPGAPRGAAPCLVANGIEPEFKSLQTASISGPGSRGGTSEVDEDVGRHAADGKELPVVLLA